MSGTGDDPNNSAAQNAARLASNVVPENGPADLAAEFQEQLLSLKRRIAGSRSLQKMLTEGAATVEDFHQRLVKIGADHGVTLTPAAIHDFLMKRTALGGAEVPDPPPPSSMGHTCEHTCTWNPYDHNCSYPPAG